MRAISDLASPAPSEGRSTWSLAFDLALLTLATFGVWSAVSAHPAAPLVESVGYEARLPAALPARPLPSQDALGGLLIQQAPDGSFGGALPEERFLTTAFVLTALSDCHLPRTPQLERGLRGAAAYLLDAQREDGAFFVAGVDRTLIALMALTAYQEGAPSQRLLLALPLYPSEFSRALQEPVADGSGPLRAAYALYRAYRQRS